MFWVSFTCKKRGRFVPRCRLRNRSSRWAVVFLTDHRHFVHFLKAEFQPTSAASARWLRSKTCPICITSAPNNSRGGDGSTRLWEIPKTPSALEHCQNHRDKCGSAPQLGPNWNVTEYCRTLVPDMPSENENLNGLALTGPRCSSCQPNHYRLNWFDSVLFRVVLMFSRQSA